MFSSDPLSHGLAGDGHDSMHYGMIATGNHQYFNSLRGAPPFDQQGKPRAASGRPYRFYRLILLVKIQAFPRLYHLIIKCT